LTTEVALFSILVCIVANGFFAGVETGITSARRIPVQHRARQGHRPSMLTARLLVRREDGIVTAVVGNNIMIVAGTSIATAFLVDRLGQSGETVAAVAMTILNILFGELLPKSLYRARPETLLTWSAPLFIALAWLLLPLRWLAASTAKAALQLVGLYPPQADPRMTRERLLSVFRRSRRHRELDAGQQDLVQRLVHNCQTPVEAIMTPLDRVAKLGPDDRVVDAISLVRETGHSRIPVADPSGNIRGLIFFRDLIQASPQDPVAGYERSLAAFPRRMGLDEAIGALTDRRQSMASVVDDADRSIGILTLEDLLEPLVGEILDEHDASAAGQEGAESAG
jgi:CBS domain containing-hemolysin-like protein